MSDYTDVRDSFIQHVKAFFTSLKAKAIALFESGINAIESAAKANEGKVEGDIIQYFKDTAADAVAAASITSGDGSAKFAAAFAAVTADFATKGIQLGKNEITLLIENAYANFKASQPQVAAVVDAVAQTAEVAQAEATVAAVVTGAPQ